MDLAKEIGRCEQLSRVWCDRYLAHGSSMAVLTATARPLGVGSRLLAPSSQ